MTEMGAVISRGLGLLRGSARHEWGGRHEPLIQVVDCVPRGKPACSTFREQTFSRTGGSRELQVPTAPPIDCHPRSLSLPLPLALLQHRLHTTFPSPAVDPRLCHPTLSLAAHSFAASQHIPSARTQHQNFNPCGLSLPIAHSFRHFTSVKDTARQVTSRTQSLALVKQDNCHQTSPWSHFRRQLGD
jgi:hypothetical protein